MPNKANTYGVSCKNIALLIFVLALLILKPALVFSEDHEVCISSPG